MRAKAFGMGAKERKQREDGGRKKKNGKEYVGDQQSKCLNA